MESQNERLRDGILVIILLSYFKNPIFILPG